MLTEAWGNKPPFLEVQPFFIQVLTHFIPFPCCPHRVIGGKALKKRGERREEKERKEKKGKEKKGFSSQYPGKIPQTW
jgi:hypothetical protein